MWVARQRLPGGQAKLVALKTLLPALAIDDRARRQFAEESRVSARILHPNVRAVFGLVEERGILALPMEWVDGASLMDMLGASSSRLDPRLVARIVALAAAGLHAAHQVRDEGGRPLRLVHRDISPQNILIGRSGQVKLTDFGIAKVAYHSCDATLAGQVKGKVGYMSPEQAQGLPLDARSDVFSLGAVLYFAALGKRPFRRLGESRSVSVQRLLRGQYVRPLDVDPRLSRGLAEIVEQALETDPRRRFQSAADLQTALETWLASSGTAPTQEDVARALARSCEGRLIEREHAICLALGLTSPQSRPRAPLFAARTKPWLGSRLVAGIGLLTLLGTLPLLLGSRAAATEASPRQAAAAPKSLRPEPVRPPSSPEPSLPCPVAVENLPEMRELRALLGPNESSRRSRAARPQSHIGPQPHGANQPALPEAPPPAEAQEARSHDALLVERL